MCKQEIQQAPAFMFLFLFLFFVDRNKSSKRVCKIVVFQHVIVHSAAARQTLCCHNLQVYF